MDQTLYDMLSTAENDNPHHEHVDANRGTPYPCTQSDIDDFQHRVTPSDHEVLSKIAAVHTLETFLDPLLRPSRQVLEALTRLRAARWNPYSGPDIIIKAAHDLDVAFFDGRLRGNVTVRWGHTWAVPSNLRARTFRKFGMMWPGLGPDLGLCIIHLYADQILFAANPCEQMWQTMFHEMIHAYGIVMAHTTNLGMGTDIDPGHGQYFERLRRFVDYRAHTYMNMCVIGVWETVRFPWRNMSADDDERRRMLALSCGR